MPCLAMHLAVAKKYLEKHPEENKEDFILGTIAPDINMSNIGEYINGVTEDKNSHHFGLNYQTENIIDYMKKKVDFSLFFQSNYITDERLFGLSFKEAAKIGYNDYDLITPILISKYDLEIPEEIRSIVMGKGEGHIKLLDENLVYRFIDEMADVNLDEEKSRLIHNLKK